MCNALAWPQQCWRELCKRIQHCSATLQRSRSKRDVGSRWFKSLNGFKLCAKTPNNMQQGVQTDATCNIQQCWELLVNIVASVFTGLNIYPNSTCLECFHGFLCVCYQVISVFSYVWKPCVPVPDHILKNAKSLGFKLNSPILMFFVCK